MVVGVIVLVALARGAVAVWALTGRSGRRGRAASGALTLALVGLMSAQLGSEVPGLDRLGWTSVGVEAGRVGQVLVVALLAALLATAVLEIWSVRAGRPVAVGRVAASLGLVAAAGSLLAAVTCFVE